MQQLSSPEIHTCSLTKTRVVFSRAQHNKTIINAILFWSPTEHNQWQAQNYTLVIEVYFTLCIGVQFKETRNQDRCTSVKNVSLKLIHWWIVRRPWREGSEKHEIDFTPINTFNDWSSVIFGWQINSPFVGYCIYTQSQIVYVPQYKVLKAFNIQIQLKPIPFPKRSIH